MLSPESLWPNEHWNNSFHCSHGRKCLSQLQFCTQAIITICLLKQHTNGTVPETARSFPRICQGCLNPGTCKHVSRNLNVTSDGIIGEHQRSHSSSIYGYFQNNLWKTEEDQSTQTFPLTLDAAPPLIMDLTKIPKSAWFSFDRLPLTLTPSPADPESFSGTSKVRNSLVPSGVRTSSSSSAFCWGDQHGIIEQHFSGNSLPSTGISIQNSLLLTTMPQYFPQ